MSVKIKRKMSFFQLIASVSDKKDVQALECMCFIINLIWYYLQAWSTLF